MVFKPKIEKSKIEEIINKGAPVKEDFVDDEEYTAIKLRLPKALYAALGEMAKDVLGISKTGLIIQAIDYKVKEWRKTKNDLSS